MFLMKHSQLSSNHVKMILSEETPEQELNTWFRKLAACIDIDVSI